MSVLRYLQQTASHLTLSSTERETVDHALARVRTNLTAYFSADVVTAQYCFGSLPRGTALPRRVNPASDIDYMAVFANPEGVKPQTLIERLKRFAAEHYPRTETFQSHPTVVLNLSRFRIELVPAQNSWFRGLSIPAKATAFSEWTSTDPEGFQRRLDRKDEANGGEIRPVIRLLKLWNVSNGAIFDSYELERIVIDHGFWGVRHDLKTRFFSIFDSLPTSGLSSRNRDLIRSAREVVRRVREFEGLGYSEYAEQEIASRVLKKARVSLAMEGC